MTREEIAPLLLDYASGALSEPESLAVATHIALNPLSARVYGALNEIGGALLEELEGPPVASGEIECLLERLEDRDLETSAAVKPRGLPGPLGGYIDRPFEALQWTRIGIGAFQHDFTVGDGSYRTALIKLKGGRKMPRHRHGGREFTVVLEGAYTDLGRRYAKGDLQFADDKVEHQPIAEKGDGCLCLIVVDAPLQFTGPIGRLLNPFIRY